MPATTADMKNILMIGLAMAFIVPGAVRAGDQAAVDPIAVAPSIADKTAGTRFGLFDGLDSRSSYGQGIFPEPFLVDDSDLETNEARLDWLHTAGQGNQHTDLVTGEVEKGFGQLTLEVEAPIERDSSSGQISTNFGNVDLGARYPFYEYVAPKGEFDSTFGAALEVGVPVGSIIARNTEVVPKIFNDLRIGEHFTLQSLLGYSAIIGNSGDEGRLQSFEYGFVFGYTIPHEQLAIPGVLQLIPVFELNGATAMNKDVHGDNSLLADAGFRANLKAVGSLQPRLGIAYVFPVDYGAHQDVHWGVVTSLVFEY
jgi:hypothetical protein